jgi:hypothetical protein
VSVFDFGTASDGRLFIAMELIRGRTLHAILAADGTFPVERAARVGGQICDALEAAHRLGIVHRDLKLDNVMVLDDPPGRDLVKVLDFGLAKKVGVHDPRATGTGVVVGTPRYIAPELAYGNEMSPAADIYALGVILAELVLGRPLWDGDDLSNLLSKKLTPRAAIVNVPGPLHDLVADLIAVDPRDRPSAAAVREQLARVQAMPSQPRSAAMPADPGTAATVAQTPRGKRTQRWGTFSLVLLAVITVGLIVVGFVVPGGSKAPVDARAVTPVTATDADPWKTGALPTHNERVTLVIDTDPPGGQITLGERPVAAPFTTQVSTNAHVVPIIALWQKGRHVTQSATFLHSFATDRHIVMHPPSRDHAVHHATHCTPCAPPELAAPAIIHVTSKPDHLAVTLDDQPIGTTPFDLDADLDSESFVLIAGTLRALVNPDHDQTVELSAERTR